MRKFVGWAWGGISQFFDKHRYLATMISVVTGIIAIIQFMYWQPPAHVSLDFEAHMGGWMRPDFGLADDLKSWASKTPAKKPLGWLITTL
jgi:hypothetical protein